MRKRNVNHLADTIFWYLIYFLPIIAYLLYMLAEPSNGTTVLNLSEFFSSIGLGFVNDNLILSSLNSIFGSNGILPLFSTNAPLLVFTWFICTFIAHLFVDFLLFIPRLTHKWMNKFTQGDE